MNYIYSLYGAEDIPTDLHEDLEAAVKEYGPVITRELEYQYDKEDPNWKVISNVELLVLVHKGTKIFNYEVKDKHWVEVKL